MGRLDLECRPLSLVRLARSSSERCQSLVAATAHGVCLLLWGKRSRWRCFAFWLQLGWLGSTGACGDGTAAGERAFGLSRRIPWNDSRVVGSPDPILPYKVVRAFPKLIVKQPLSLTPEPGTNRLFVLQHLNFWAGPGRLLAVPDDQAASEAALLLEIDGLAVGIAFHPDYRKNGYLYIGLNGPMAGEDKKTQVVRYTVDRHAPSWDRPEFEVGHHRVAVQWAQRWRYCVRQ